MKHNQSDLLQNENSSQFLHNSLSDTKCYFNFFTDKTKVTADDICKAEDKSIVKDCLILLDKEYLEHTFENNTCFKYLFAPNLERTAINQFSQCSCLSLVYCPKLTVAGEQSFAGCPLQMLNLPELLDVHARCFTASTLQSLHLPKVERISQNNFEHCQSLTSLELPAVKEIDEDVFTQCGVAELFLPMLE